MSGGRYRSRVRKRLPVQRTLLTGNAPYDRYKNGDRKALTPAQVHGMKVFFENAKCDQCHEGANFTFNTFAN